MLTYSGLYDAVSSLLDRAERADQIAAKVIGKPYGKLDKKLAGISEQGITFSYEYWDGCHCHGSSETDEYLIPAEWIDTDDGEEMHRHILDEKQRRDEEAERAKQAEETKKREAEARRQAEIEFRDRQTYERLKAKYEGD